MKVLLIDNYDSFVYNLKQMLGELGAECIVRRNDEVTIDDIRSIAPDAIVLSPGPGHPTNKRDFGICGAVLQEISPNVPTLGVCLGHQGIATTFGGKVEKAPVPVHGKVTEIKHFCSGLFNGLPNPLPVGRYHSLVVSQLPDNLRATAYSPDGLIMALQHELFPIYGVQFHPESVLTPSGKQVLANFIEMAK
ncbi:MAG: Anthranilate synthase component 2 [Methanomassiliicoccales archaeon PtaU1.Bin124]|nr:MAG: Anthranilate synthase component 2 [Methanomassiliicoccales archaeon PtaU1.Bin124]